MNYRKPVRLAILSLALSACLCIIGCDDNVSYDFFSTIHGAVYDAGTGAPLSNASVTLMPSSRTLQTGEDGTFVLKNWTPANIPYPHRKKAIRQTVSQLQP